MLDMLADGMDWDSISKAWGGKVTKSAIAEAVNRANQIFIDHLDEYQLEYVSA